MTVDLRSIVLEGFPIEIFAEVNRAYDADVQSTLSDFGQVIDSLHALSQQRRYQLKRHPDTLGELIQMAILRRPIHSNSAVVLVASQVPSSLRALRELRHEEDAQRVRHSKSNIAAFAQVLVASETFRRHWLGLCQRQFSRIQKVVSAKPCLLAGFLVLREGRAC